MKQTRIMSLIEAITNVVVGYGVAFMGISLIRSFALRRAFEVARARQSLRRNRHFWTKPCLPVYALHLLPACPPST